ncbi:lipopolysaccharide biosynthesis protein, partial [Salinarimonas soli]|uniref:lipopolysaccharide biosynthesis protein n=1 Tax=Salinarimonas soli TaxID=1638099 RepID=UPI0023E7B81C
MRHTAAYLTANVLSAVFGFVSVFLFTRLLTPDDYGLFVLGQTATAILSTSLFAWVAFSLFRYQTEGEHVDVRTTALVGFAASTSILLAGGLLAVLAAGVHPLLALGTCTFAAAFNFFGLTQNVMRARLDAGQVMRSSILRSLLAFALGVTFVLLGGGGFGLLLSMSLAFLLSCLPYLRQCWGDLKEQLAWATMRSFLSLGVPIALSGFIFSFSGGLDRLAIGTLLGKGASGEYGASAELVRQIIAMPMLSIASAVLPIAVRLLASEGPKAAQRHMERGGELLLAIVAPMAVGLAIVTPALAAVVVGADFRPAAEALIPILAVTAIFGAMNQGFVHASFHLAKAPRLMFWHGCLQLGTNALVMYPLVTGYGIRGAALAMLISEGVALAGGLMLARRGFPLSLPLGRLARVGVALGAMGAAALGVRAALDRADLVAMIAIAAAGAATYAAAALALDLGGARST